MQLGRTHGGAARRAARVSEWLWTNTGVNFTRCEVGGRAGDAGAVASCCTDVRRALGLCVWHARGASERQLLYGQWMVDVHMANGVHMAIGRPTPG